MTLPTPYDPNISPELALYVRRAGLPIEVYMGQACLSYIVSTAALSGAYSSPVDAHNAYVRERERLLAAYLPAAPERGGLVDEVC